MNINWIKTIVVLLLIGLNTAESRGQGNTYVALYPDECREAEVFYSEHKSLFEAAVQGMDVTPEFLFAVVAPELTQYSYLRNKLETYSLKVFYVQAGKAYSDFSIGYFQMKPSFIEKLEEYVSADSLLKTRYAFCLFDRPDERASRTERISRLGTVEWQIKYLAVFCGIVNQKFAAVAFSTEEEKLRFYASAYNCGFHKTATQIKEMEQKSIFPRFSTQKFKYADISVWFYNRRKFS
ncbi:MAG: hypothetical protein LBB85_02730 [Dysgonamonadaceae bacterium]|jgi:hypothetical protein|nr:hypothetical protein [Dysgonamonadaceae bacterium]